MSLPILDLVATRPIGYDVKHPCGAGQLPRRNLVGRLPGALHSRRRDSRGFSCRLCSRFSVVERTMKLLPSTLFVWSVWCLAAAAQEPAARLAPGLPGLNPPAPPAKLHPLDDDDNRAV